MNRFAGGNKELPIGNGRRDDLPKKLTFVFPYYLGSTLERFSTSLLYHRSLAASVPAFLTPDVLMSVYNLQDIAISRNSELRPVLAAALHLLRGAQDDYLHFSKLIEPLEKKILSVRLMYPGDSEAYKQTKYSKEALWKAFMLLNGEPHRMAAAVDLVWRIFEYVTEYRDAKAALLALEDRSRHLGSPWLLLSECYLNRISMVCSDHTSNLNVVLDSYECGSLIGMTGNLEAKTCLTPINGMVEEQIKFMLFDALLAQYTPPLDSADNAKKLASLLRDRESELAELSAELDSAAKDIKSAGEDKRHEAYHDTLSSLLPQVSKIADLDSSARASLFNNVTADKALWASIASVLGTALGTLPPVLPTATAVYAFCSIGVEALKARRERAKLLDDSPWSFVYYAQRLRKSRD